MLIRGTVHTVLAVAGLAGCLGALAATADAPVPFPEGYRHWVHVGSMMVGAKSGVFDKQPCEKPCSGGIFHFYANDLALEGYRTGKFADGAIFADELLEIKQKEEVGFDGPRRGVGVMVRDSQRFRDTGGWGFGAFDGDGRTQTLAADGQKACFACHAARKDHAYVFTEYHE